MDTKIYSKIASAGVITEREVLLMKNRANRGLADDVFTIFDNGRLQITPEQADKGLAWLKDLWKTPRGVVRKRNRSNSASSASLTLLTTSSWSLSETAGTGLSTGTCQFTVYITSLVTTSTM